jgi:[ribosomal protein S5]-alanine N-acetyltransferase
MEKRAKIIALPSGGRLRPWTAADAETLVALANDRAIWRNMRDQFPHPYTAENAAFFLSNLANKAEAGPIRAIENAAGQVVGSIGLHFKHDVSHRSAEIGYWLGQQFWGQGLATEALQALTDYGFATYKLARIYALVFAWNPASGRVLEKAGYTFEARLRDAVTKDGQTIDGLLYARLHP